MDIVQAARVCAALGLGTVQAEPEAVQGGLLHSMWRLRTGQGSFALKCLNPAIMRRPGIEQVYRLSERIAAMLAAQGIPAVAALADVSGNVLQDVDGMKVLVYPWVDGETLPPGAVAPERAARIGAVLAHIHALNLQVPDLEPLALSAWSHFHDEDWDILTYQASDPTLHWAYPVRAAIPRLLAMTRAYEAAGPALLQHLVVSHTDLDQKNVLWRDAQTPCLIDWESAGLINPTMELASVALYWAGITAGQPDERVVAATIEGYVRAGGVIVASGLEAIHGFMGTWLGWLLFNMRRSLGECTHDPDECEPGVREATNALNVLRLLDMHAETWAGWVDAWR